MALAGLGGCLEDGNDAEYGWNEIESPVEETLYDVVVTFEGPYAVGEGGRIVARRSDEWEVVTEDGPANAANRLSGAAVTDDGRHVWFAGSSGAIGQRDVLNGEATDRSAPKEKTSSWEDIAVVGRAGEERIHLINGSGELLSGTNRNGDIDWGEITKPGNGTEPTAVEFTGGTGFITDGNGGVYGTAGGDEWQRIGIRSSDTALNDVVALNAQTINVVTGEGSIFLYNGFDWLRLEVGRNGLNAIDRSRDRGFVVGASGAVYELTDSEWKSQNTPTSKTLRGVTLGTTDYADVAVGDGGLILERFR